MHQFLRLDFKAKGVEPRRSWGSGNLWELPGPLKLGNGGVSDQFFVGGSPTIWPLELSTSVRSVVSISDTVGGEAGT